MTIVVLDVETTGLGHAGYPPRSDGVVQIGLAWRNGERIESYSDYCNPGKKFLVNGRANIALSINGISAEKIVSSKPAASVARDFWGLVQQIEEIDGEVEFRAYNRHFDAGFLAQRPWSVPDEMWGDCIMVNAANKLVGRQRLKLSKAMELLQLPWPGTAHDAKHDAHAALLVCEKLACLQ